MGSKSFEKRLAPPVDRRRIHYTPPPGDGRFHVWRGPLRISPPSESFVHGSRRFITASALKWDGLRTAGIVLMRLWRRRRAFTMRLERASERCGDVLAGRRLTATSHAREKTAASHRPTTLYIPWSIARHQPPSEICQHSANETACLSDHGLMSSK